MIDRQLLNYPEQLAARLTQMENDIRALEREVSRLKKGAN